MTHRPEVQIKLEEELELTYTQKHTEIFIRESTLDMITLNKKSSTKQDGKNHDRGLGQGIFYLVFSPL